ncbi:hypothetical protein [Streptomyces huiliensis]|uniref:hypothetical protein n=1 Tax=Streptomyces huiliensis TaxID=2876027 RepID=UPI001CC009E6|nr:hypothetical protein [Streptomyces huiliensis]MBZ4321099.1 hypothetical protein [Streptomyces huiliensis]
MTEPPAIGSYVADIERNKIGQVMAGDQDLIQLRPVDGGLEWDAKPNTVRPATLEEVLSAKVKAANNRPRWGQ